MRDRYSKNREEVAKQAGSRHKFPMRLEPMVPIAEFLREWKHLSGESVLHEADPPTGIDDSQMRKWPARILLVHAEPSVLSALSILLKNKGYAIFTADSGVEGEALLTAEDFDLVMCRVRMLLPPNGFDSLQLINREKRKVQAVFLRSWGGSETIIDAMRLGAYDLQTVPFKASELLETVQHALENDRSYCGHHAWRSLLTSAIRHRTLHEASAGLGIPPEELERMLLHYGVPQYEYSGVPTDDP